VKVLQQNTWIDDRKFLKSCVRARVEQGNINHPTYGTWTADFMLRQNESRAFIGKYLNDLRVPWRDKSREMMAIAGIIPVAKWLAKNKQRSDVNCRLCKRAREQRGASTENLPGETYGQINSAFCNGMATTVTAVHHFILRHLYASIQAAQTPTSQLRFVTSDKESSMSTLWQEEEFKQICSRTSLTEKAADIEKRIVVKEHERARYDFSPTMFYENRFRNRRPDGIVINKYHRTLEFKRSSDRNKDFLRVKEDEANEQHKSIIEALRAAALEWTFQQINFVAGNGGAVVEDNFYNKLEKLNVQAGKKDKILLARVQRICEAHDTVMRSYYQQIHGSSGADTTTSMENIGEQVYV